MAIPRALRSVPRELLYLVVIGLAVHLIIPQIASFRRALELLRTISPLLLLSATVAQALSYVGTGYLNCAIVELYGQRIGLWRAIVIGFASGSAGEVAGGTVVSGAANFRWIRESGADADAATLAGWLPSLLNTSIHVGLGIVSLLYLLWKGRLSPVLLTTSVATTIVLAAILLLPVWAMIREERFRTMIELSVRLVAWVRRREADPATTDLVMERVGEAGERLRHGGWHRPMLGALANVGFDLVTIALLFVATGDALSPGHLLAGYGIPAMLGKLNLLPGGIGLVEGSMAGLYHAVGVPATTIVVVVLLYRLLSLWIPLVIGFVAGAYLEHHHQMDARKEVSES